MRAYLQHAYGARDQLAYGSGTTIPHVAPLMRATLATGTQRHYPESRAVHGAGFRVCAQEGASATTQTFTSSQDEKKIFCRDLKIPIDIFLDICIYSPHCPAGSLSRGDPRPDRTAEPGRPGTAAGLGWWSAGRRSACLGRARCLAARGGYVNPASRVPRWAPWRLPPLHPLAQFARDWQTSDALRRENAKSCSQRSSCLNLRNHNLSHDLATYARP
jgi:hypothetical protein